MFVIAPQAFWRKGSTHGAGRRWPGAGHGARKMGGLRKEVESRFRLEEVEINDTTFAGRRVICKPDQIPVSMERYILEELHPVTLSQTRRADSPSLTEEEFMSLRSAIYNCIWSGREVRPEASAAANIFASQLSTATVQDARSLNTKVQYLCSTAARPVTMWRIDPISKTFASMPNVGGMRSTTEELDSSQAGRDGRRNVHIPKNRESQSNLVEKRQAQEEGVKHACRRDLCSESGRGGGGMTASDVEGHHGRRRGGAQQAQFAKHRRTVSQDQRGAGALDQEVTSPSQSPIEIFCRADSQRVLLTREGSRWQWSVLEKMAP